MNNKIRRFPLARTLLTGALFTAGWVQAQDGSAFLGRWALTTPDKQAGWLEIKQENGWCDGSILWMWGSVVPVADVVVDGSTLTVTRVSDVPRKDEANRVVRTQQLTEIITAQVTGDAMNLTRTVPRKDGSGFDRSQFTGRRIPALPPAPDLVKVRFGAQAVPPSTWLTLIMMLDHAVQLSVAVTCALIVASSRKLAGLQPRLAPAGT